MYRAEEIATYILLYYHFERDIRITNYRLQNTLYYVQAEYLATKYEPLFDDDFEAWGFGPVINHVYEQFQIYGGGTIPMYFAKKTNIIHDETTKAIVNNILDELLQYKDSELRAFVTHQTPWMDAWQKYRLRKMCGFENPEIITKTSIYQFFVEN